LHKKIVFSADDRSQAGGEHETACLDLIDLIRRFRSGRTRFEVLCRQTLRGRPPSRRSGEQAIYEWGDERFDQRGDQDQGEDHHGEHLEDVDECLLTVGKIILRNKLEEFVGSDRQLGPFPKETFRHLRGKIEGETGDKNHRWDFDDPMRKNQSEKTHDDRFMMNQPDDKDQA
jgi:hypothetical protein